LKIYREVDRGGGEARFREKQNMIRGYRVAEAERLTTEQ
jgi:hypothetical protein